MWDLNINYAETNNKKAKLDNLLSTYNLTGTVLFPQELPIHPLPVPW